MEKITAYTIIMKEDAEKIVTTIGFCNLASLVNVKSLEDIKLGDFSSPSKDDIGTLIRWARDFARQAGKTTLKDFYKSGVVNANDEIEANGIQDALNKAGTEFERVVNEKRRKAVSEMQAELNVLLGDDEDDD